MLSNALFAAHLAPYQQAALQWADNKNGFILACEMGTGKTRMSLAYAFGHPLSRPLTARIPRPILILAPLGTLSQWQAEIRLLVGEDADVHVYHGPKRKEAFTAWGQTTTTAAYRLVLSTPQTWRQDAFTRNLVTETEYSLAILDEAHNYRNRKSLSFKAINQHLVTTVCCLLTGTPYYNKVDDMIALALLTRVPPYDHKDWWKEASNEQRQEWRTNYCYQVTKDEVLVLPPLRIQTHLLALPPTQRGYYQAVNNSEYGCGLTKILRLRQATCLNPPGHPELVHNVRADKILELIGIVRRSAGQERIVVFSIFRQFLELLQGFLQQEMNIEPLMYHGGVKQGDRAALLTAFEATPGSILLVSLMAGGAGLNLQVANHAILAEPYWNYASSGQAMDRIYRLGQRRSCQIHYLVTNTPIDHRMVKKQEIKIKSFTEFTPNLKQVVRIDLPRTADEIAETVDSNRNPETIRPDYLRSINAVLCETPLANSLYCRQKILRYYCHPFQLPMELELSFNPTIQSSDNSASVSLEKPTEALAAEE